MDEFLHQPGFFGTSANRAGDITLTLIIISAALFTLGAALALRGRYEAHRKVQTAGVILSSVMVLWMMVFPFIDFVIRDTGGPRPAQFYLVTSLHGLVGIAAFFFGIFVALRGNKLLIPERFRFNNYKPYMRAAYGLYMLVILLGVWTYFTWYVGNPNPPEYGTEEAAWILTGGY
jgi:uncharacterized membrane protein YozB (DUF420 family)